MDSVKDVAFSMNATNGQSTETPTSIKIPVHLDLEGK